MVKIHRKSFSDGGAVRAVDAVADNVRILVHANALHTFVVNSVDAVRQRRKTVAGLVVAVGLPDHFRRITKKIADFANKCMAQHLRYVGKAGFLKLCGLFDVLRSITAFPEMEKIVFCFKGRPFRKALPPYT